MSFNEIYNILKSENVDRICFVETGSFFVTIGSDAECLSETLLKFLKKLRVIYYCNIFKYIV